MNRPSTLNRREFMAGAAALAAACGAPAAADPMPDPAWNRLPRWRGFNLPDMCVADYSKPFREEDFAWISEWGFDFARLPVSYRCYTDAADWLKVKEDSLKEFDRAIEFGRKHGVHTCLNLHRAPGYCVNPPAEPLSLWSDAKALDACAFHWGLLAKRYKGIPNRNLTFDLLNEPARIAEDTYFRVVKRLVEAIRAEDSSRLVIADGLEWGRKPVPNLVELKVAQSTRGYDPMGITHYQANWVAGSNLWPEPAWPLPGGERNGWDRERLKRECIDPWKELEKKGVGIHVGEWGAFNRTSHPVALAWMRDRLDLWRDAGWGWAMWNFRGAFGILDSGRKDVRYESFRGHQLDRAMLDLIRAY